MSIDIITEDKLIQGILLHGTDIIEFCESSLDFSKYKNRIEEERLSYPFPKKSLDIKNWLIPNEYKNMDIENFLIDNCPKQNYERLIKELELYRKHDMIDILRVMKYIVDTLRKNHIVWGVGRGSSVASYALFLIGVHKIDSVKYSLPIEEFFKGDKNG